MKARRVIRKPTVEVDLQQLLEALLRKLWLIVIVGVLGAMFSFMFTYSFIPAKYSSYALFFVNNTSKVGDHFIIRTTDIRASQKLLEAYTVILMTKETLEKVIDYADVDLTYTQLRHMIEFEGPMGDTTAFRVNVTSTDPEEAYKLAAAIEHIMPDEVSGIIDNTSVKVLEHALLSHSRVGPNYSRNTMIGFGVGVLLVVLVITMRLSADVRVHREEDIVKCCPYPILTAVPDMWGISRGGYYSYEGKKVSLKKQVDQLIKPELVGSGISFAATEAYKLLRTKLLFSFADDKECHVIGVSSALAGEGKSLTSVNLAYSLAQMNKKILLIDCDMRRPSLSVKLPIDQEPGLSDHLSGQRPLDGLIQFCGIPGEEECFHVLAAGPIPPNPVELLNTERTGQMLEVLRRNYDYVILDLPPVGEVSDALSVTNMADGMLMVVRQNYCDKHALHRVIQQFRFMNGRMLGVVYNCASEGNGVYKKQYYKYAKYASSYYKAQRKMKNR